jgi:hypothetical protein
MALTEKDSLLRADAFPKSTVTKMAPEVLEIDVYD